MSASDEEYTIEELLAMTDDQRMQLVCRRSDELRRRIADRFRAANPGCAAWEVKMELLRHAFAPDPVPEGVEALLRENDGPVWA